MKKELNNKIQYLCDKWQLTNLRNIEYATGTNNYVSIVYSSLLKTDVVLKILEVKTDEIEALKFFDGNGCVKLLNCDIDMQGFLIEYVKPGYTLKTLFPNDDDTAIEISANIIKKIKQNNLSINKYNFKTIDDWLKKLDTIQSKKIPHDLLLEAQILYKNLLNKKSDFYLLHGDLHHENILKNNDDWIAIDPKGIIGPIEYEIGRFIMNPIPDLIEQPNSKEIIKIRIEKFCEIFQLNNKNLIDWTFVQSILSCCWTEEYGSESFFKYFLNFSKIIK